MTQHTSSAAPVIDLTLLSSDSDEQSEAPQTYDGCRYLAAIDVGVVNLAYIVVDMHRRQVVAWRNRPLAPAIEQAHGRTSVSMADYARWVQLLVSDIEDELPPLYDAQNQSIGDQIRFIVEVQLQPGSPKAWLAVAKNVAVEAAIHSVCAERRIRCSSISSRSIQGSFNLPVRNRAAKKAAAIRLATEALTGGDLVFPNNIARDFEDASKQDDLADAYLLVRFFINRE
jgi:hypothetical protein